MFDLPLTEFEKEVMARATVLLEQPSAERAELVAQTEQALVAKEADAVLAPAQ